MNALSRITPLVLALALLAGCGSPAGKDLSPEERTQLYRTAIENARDQDLNDALPIVTSAEEETGQALFDVLGLAPEDCAACAPSVSLMNVKAYGIAAVYPADGREAQVEEGLAAFIDQQRQNFQQYLPDQYEIAQAARLETLSDGTILMVMCEDQDGVFDRISAAIIEGEG